MCYREVRSNQLNIIFIEFHHQYCTMAQAVGLCLLTADNKIIDLGCCVHMLRLDIAYIFFLQFYSVFAFVRVLRLVLQHFTTQLLSEIYTGLFISPSGTSELDCATTKTDTAERSVRIGTESLKAFFCTRGLGVLAGSTARG